MWVSTRKMNFYVYVYYDPADMKPFYVGKGKGPRANAHISQTKRWLENNGNIREKHINLDKILKIASILDKGMSPIVMYSMKNVSETAAYDEEKRLIELYGVENLTNKTIGGGSLEGRNNPNYGNVWTPELREHASKVHKAKYENGYVNPATGRKRKDLAERNKQGTKKVYKINYQNEVVHIFDGVRQATKTDSFCGTKIKQGGLPSNGFFYRYEPHVENIEALIAHKDAPRNARQVQKFDLAGNLLETFISVEEAVKSIEDLGGKYDALYWNMKKGKPYKGFLWVKG